MMNATLFIHMSFLTLEHLFVSMPKWHFVNQHNSFFLVLVFFSFSISTFITRISKELTSASLDY